jgi:hypothetical protein
MGTSCSTCLTATEADTTAALKSLTTATALIQSDITSLIALVEALKPITSSPLVVPAGVPVVKT